MIGLGELALCAVAALITSPLMKPGPGYYEKKEPEKESKPYVDTEDMYKYTKMPN